MLSTAGHSFILTESRNKTTVSTCVQSWGLDANWPDKEGEGNETTKAGGVSATRIGATAAVAVTTEADR